MTLSLAVARRLAEDPGCTVAVVEAGEFYEFSMEITQQYPEYLLHSWGLTLCAVTLFSTGTSLL